MRGQVSIEYLVLTSFLLLVAGVLFVYSFNAINQANYFVNARNSVELVGAAVEQVSALGVGSQKIVDVSLPDSTVSFVAGGKNINLRVSYDDVNTDFWFESSSSITPVVLSSSPGFHRLKIVFSDGNVLISEVN